MTNIRLLKPSITSILIILLMTLQMSACSTEEFAADNNIISDTSGTSDPSDPSDPTSPTSPTNPTNPTNPPGANQAAIISGTDNGSVTEDVDPDGDNLLEVSGKLNITDSDAGEAAFIATTQPGHFGNLTIDASGNWNYAASNSQAIIQNLASSDTLQESITIRSIDSTKHAVVITIIGVNEPNQGSNQAAIITGTDNGSVTEDVDPDANNLLEVSGKLNITDSDTGEAAFITTIQHGNYGNLTIDAAGNWNYAASNSQSTIQNLTGSDTSQDTFTISSIDGTTHTVVITIFGADEPNTFADVNLSWTAPSQREDNTVILLSEISGYKVYYGSTQGSYSSSVNINDSSAVGHVFKNFPTGTYYFVVTTFDIEGRESQFSPEVKIII